ncbi:hypothetical protein ACH5RR_015099 [Cinchona calisaya]|uniref:E3 ubiquitin-protein ligase RMA n=1 Tax=Cinchona calisaya TaxID=153742 RepID=A0ABD2ZVA4_9GENT
MEFEEQLAQELKPMNPTSTTAAEKMSGCFDCSICLEFACDPVVTVCGHLYCWPCIYKWLEFQKSSLSSNDHSKCPVCKAKISHESVVPLYGRGRSLSEDDKVDKNSTSLNNVIPPRPNAFARQAQTITSSTTTLRRRLPSHNPYQNLQSLSYPAAATSEEALSSALSNNLGSPSAICHPIGGNYGEMVYARVFGNSDRLYSYPNSYHTEANSSPRLRRQEIQAFKSLNRISVFLFCCLLSCLLLF